MNSTVPLQIILPTFNSETFLKKRLDSINRQTFKDWHIINIDSGSLDDSVTMIREIIPKEKVSFFFHPPGLYQSWNYALSKCKAEFIHIATSDDWEEADFYERLLAIMRENRCDLAHSAFRIVDSEDRVIGQSYEYFWPAEVFGWRLGRVYAKPCLPDFFYSFELGYSVISMNSAIFRRDLLEKAGYFPTDCGYLGDWLWYLNARLKSNVWCIDEPLAAFRYRRNQATAHYWRGYAFRWDNLIRLRGIKYLQKSEIWPKLTAPQKEKLLGRKRILNRLSRAKMGFYFLHALQYPDIFLHAFTKLINPFWSPSWFQKQRVKQWLK